MKEFNLYLLDLDYSRLKALFQREGKRHVYRKKDFFVRQNNPSCFAGWIESGTFHYTCINEEGKEHTVGFAFSDEFVCDYSSFMKRSSSLVNIRAVTDCTIYQLSRQDITNYWETDMDTQRFGKCIADSLYEQIYKRLLAMYCDSPEKRYIDLMERCAEIKEIVPLKTIASFLGVTPETVSHIRKKIARQGKS